MFDFPFSVKEIVTILIIIMFFIWVFIRGKSFPSLEIEDNKPTFLPTPPKNHKFGKWESKEKLKVKKAVHLGESTISTDCEKLLQYRVCEKCNLTEYVDQDNQWECI